MCKFNVFLNLSLQFDFYLLRYSFIYLNFSSDYERLFENKLITNYELMKLVFQKN